MAEMQTHWGHRAVFQWNIFAFLLGLKSFLVYIISWMLTQPPHSHTSCQCVAQGHASCLVCHPLLLHFHWGNSILFTLENWCTSCYATHTTCTAFPLRHHPVYFRKQIYILSCHPCNLCGMSKGSLCSIFSTNTNNVYIVIWLQVFLSNTNNLGAIIWFQIIV